MPEKKMTQKPVNKKAKAKAEAKIREIVGASGNNFHAEVVRFLRKQGWSVLISPYYNDSITDKPREIDIIAEKPFGIMGFRSEIGTLNVRLIIECKFISRETVFWFDLKDQDKSIELIERSTPLKVDGPSNHHYYGEKRVAKLFSSGAERAQQNQLFYQALNQNLNAMICFRYNPSIIPEDQGTKVLETVNYPIILCNNFNKMYKVDLDNVDNEVCQIEGDFLFEINYAYLDEKKNRENEYFLIDVVDFSNFNGFIDGLDKTDIKVLKDQISFSHKKTRGEQDNE